MSAQASTVGNSLRPSQVIQILAKCYEHRNPKPIILSSPGTGKTSICHQLPKHLGKPNLPVFTFQATLYDPVEIKGLPTFAVEKDSKGNILKQVARFIPFEDMPTWPEGILIIDDLPHAPTQTQNAFMRLILEGIAGSWSLGGLFPVTTGNRSVDRAGAKDLQTAMANRFIFLDLEVNYDDWRAWAINHDICPEVIAYLGTPYGQPWLDDFKADRQINPTPRSWEFASMLFSCMKPTGQYAGLGDEKQNYGELLRKSLYGAIGQEATSKFLGWLKYFDKMPDPKDIIAGKDEYPKEMDVMYATVSALVAVTKGFDKKPKIYQRLIDYATKIPDGFTELGVLLSKDLYNMDPEVYEKLNLDKWQNRYEDVVL
jgi:hypothetical protein